MAYQCGASQGHKQGAQGQFMEERSGVARGLGTAAMETGQRRNLAAGEFNSGGVMGGGGEKIGRGFLKKYIRIYAGIDGLWKAIYAVG